MSPDALPSAGPPPRLSLPGSIAGRVPSGLRRTFLYLLAGIFFSAIGVALVFFPEKIVFAGIIATFSAVLILLRPFPGLLLYAATVFLRPAEIWPVLGPLHIERIIGVLTLASIALNDFFREGRLTIDWSRQTRWLGLFWLSTLFSMPMSYWPTRSVEMATEVLKIVAFYMMIILLVDSRRRFAVFLWFYLGMMLYLAVPSLMDYYSGNFAFAQGIERATGETSSAGNANTLGTTMVCTSILLLLLMRRRRGSWKKLILVAPFVLCIWTMVLTGSRASLLGLLGGVGFVWWTSSRRILNGAIILSLLIVGFMIIPEQYKERYQTIGSSHIDGSSQSRLDSWKQGVQMMVSRPLFGVGIGCFGVAHSSYDEGNYLESHSLYVQVPAELGLFGTIAFFGFLFQSLRTMRKTRSMLRSTPARTLEVATLEGMIGGFVVLAVSGVFGHNMLRPTWYIYAALGQVIYRIATQESSNELAPKRITGSPAGVFTR